MKTIMLVGLVVSACSVTGRVGDDLFASGTSTGTATAPAAESSSSMADPGGPGGSSEASGQGESSSPDDGDFKFDVPGDTTGPMPPSEPCSKIDFLFVIDNSGSMGAHQENLIQNFGPFMDTIAAQVEADDYHVMAIDSDACPTIDVNCVPDGCEETLGAGQVRDCTVPDGRRYLTSDLDFPTLKSTFQCVADVGVDGSSLEMPGSGMVAAIGPLSNAGECNEDFLRDDAILVVTLISDDTIGWPGDGDDAHAGDPQAWYDALVDLKHKPENLVVLGLVALLEDQSCIAFSPNESTKLIELVGMFGPQGVLGSVCSPDYNMFFQEAVSLIGTTCDNFEPPG